MFHKNERRFAFEKKAIFSLLFCITPVVGIQLAIFYFTLTARGAVFHKSPLEIKSPSYPQLLFLYPTTATNIRTRNNVHTGLQPSILKDLDRLQKILLATVIFARPTFWAAIPTFLKDHFNSCNQFHHLSHWLPLLTYTSYTSLSTAKLLLQSGPRKLVNGYTSP